MVVKTIELSEPVENEPKDEHVLKFELNGETHEFQCRDDVKLGFLVRSAKNGLEGLHDIIAYCYDGDIEDVFEVTDNLDLEDIGDSVAVLIESYTKDQKGSRTSSRGGSRRTGR